MKVITNTAISLDGRVSTDVNAPFTLGSAYDQEHMRRLRGQTDAVLVGGNTFRMRPKARIPIPPKEEPIWNIIVSRRMNFSLSAEFVNNPKIRPLFMTSAPHVSKSFPVKVVACPHDLSPEWIISELEQRGVQTLLIEAGGNLIFQFLQKNLIDEMHITLCPKIIGNTSAPSLVDGNGFLNYELKNLTLLSAKTVGNELFLHYSAKKMACL